MSPRHIPRQIAHEAERFDHDGNGIRIVGISGLWNESSDKDGLIDAWLSPFRSPQGVLIV